MVRPYRVLFDQFLLRREAEGAHRQAFAAIRAAGTALRALDRLAPVGRPVRALGLDFPNALGLAAGFDKNAVGIDALAGLGFGHVEVGTVTGEPQPGNPRPRLFRLPLDRAVINRMGFNNVGAEQVGRRLAERRARRTGAPRPVLGINIGKTKVVPEDDQAAVLADYAKSTRLLAPYADYLVVNVSSPNTPGLRSLQAVDRLEPLLREVRTVADRARADAGAGRVPLVVKIAPDLTDEDVLAVGDLAVDLGLDGIIATNTTLSRDGLRSHPDDIARIGAGGLSGAPLRQRAVDVLRLLRSRLPEEMTLIGVGGIGSVADARERLAAGADLVQGYTAFIYEGPWWPRRIAAGLDGASTGAGCQD